MSKASVGFNKNSLYTSSYFLINTQSNHNNTMMDINTKMNTTTSYQKGDHDFISRRNTTVFKPGTYNNTSIVEDNY